MALTTTSVQENEGGSEKGLPFFINNDLYCEIEEELGEVTDLEILPLENGGHLKWQLNYKSNGVLKSDYFSELKPLIASMYYVNALISPIKKYKHAR